MIKSQPHLVGFKPFKKYARQSGGFSQGIGRKIPKTFGTTNEVIFDESVDNTNSVDAAWSFFIHKKRQP